MDARVGGINIVESVSLQSRETTKDVAPFDGIFSSFFDDQDVSEVDEPQVEKIEDTTELSTDDSEIIFFADTATQNLLSEITEENIDLLSNESGLLITDEDDISYENNDLLTDENKVVAPPDNKSQGAVVFNAENNTSSQDADEQLNDKHATDENNFTIGFNPKAEQLPKEKQENITRDIDEFKQINSIDVSRSKISMLETDSEENMLELREIESTNLSGSLKSDKDNKPHPSDKLGANLADFFNSRISIPGNDISSRQQASPTNAYNQAKTQIRMELAEWQAHPSLVSTEYQIGDFSARIKIHPQDMGEIIANITIKEGSAEVALLTENTNVKQIMEANLLQLRQTFENSGVALGDVNIQNKSSNERKSSTGGNNADAESQQEQGGQNNKAKKIGGSTSARSLVDTYA